MTVTTKENTRKVICETGLRRLRKSYNGVAFILTNLIFPVELLNFIYLDFSDGFSKEFIIKTFYLYFLDCPRI